eukprot:2368748-Amphidinium_carterae.2
MCRLLAERVCRLLAVHRATLTKELCLKRCSELNQTTKAIDRRYLLGLGKASMLKTSHPRLITWLKTPGPPAVHLHQQGTAGNAFFRPPALHRLATTGTKHQCHACSLLSTNLVTPSHAVF